MHMSGSPLRVSSWSLQQLTWAWSMWELHTSRLHYSRLGPVSPAATLSALVTE
jgi:hypothetical protein